MADRSRWQLQIQSVTPPPGLRIHNDIPGTEDQEWGPGQILTLAGGSAAILEDGGAIHGTVADMGGPVKYIALEPFAGDPTVKPAVEEINQFSVLKGQLAGGEVATPEIIGSRGRLVQDATTGHYEVDLALGGKDASVEIVNTESNHSPYAPHAYGARNLVMFKFLPSVLEVAPADAET